MPTVIYPRLGKAVTERLPGRNARSVGIIAGRLGLKKSRNSETGFRPWSDEEWAQFAKIMHLRMSEQQATFFS